DDAVTRAVAERYLEPLRRAGIDTLILGCTHYPLLAAIIAATLPGVALVDSGACVAADLERALARLGIAAPAPPPGGGDTVEAMRRAEYHVTDDPQRFRDVGARFLGVAIDGPHLAELAVETVPLASARPAERRA